MTTTVRGTFEVKMQPLPPYNDAEGATAGRFALDKQFRGELEATSKGEMLTGGTVTKGSAGYVAIETVTGTLAGRNGTFMLQHSGTMDRGAPSLTIGVIPDSGTGELEGLRGTMSIEIADGQHRYTFEYTLA
ncbi:MAG TPA: DUF3224 domain-containing protein [Thermoanaerobaculia bacterium]